MFDLRRCQPLNCRNRRDFVVVELVAPRSDDAANCPNCKTEHHRRRTAQQTPTPAADTGEDAEHIAADVVEGSGWKTGPAAVSSDTLTPTVAIWVQL